MSSPQCPDPASTPTADAAERWLRQITPLLDALALHLYSESAIQAETGSLPPGRAADTVGDAGATPATDTRSRANTPPDRHAAHFCALTACPGGHVRRDTHRPCRHAHVELLIAAERETLTGEPRYAVRVVNVDLPRWRHRDAYIEPAPTWPDRGEAAAAGLRLARERWGAVAVVHSTPPPGPANAATNKGQA